MNGQGHVAHVHFEISASCEVGREVDRAGEGYLGWGDKGWIYILFQIQIPASFPILSPASQWNPWK